MVLAKSFARIHRQNLINYGILPLVFFEMGDYERLQKGNVLKTGNLREALRKGDPIRLDCDGEFAVRHGLTPRQVDIVLAGGLINWRRSSAVA
jgi:aconitate hydratase